MANFKFDFDSKYGADLQFHKEAGDVLSIDDLLEILRPAGLRLKEHFRNALNTLFQRRTGSLADSIDIEDDYVLGGDGYAQIKVKPFGKHKGGRLTRRSRAGGEGRRYAKHNRRVSSTSLTNAELGYLLEFGTPRIKATHWMENTNETVEDEIQEIIDDGFTEVLKKKGLI